MGNTQSITNNNLDLKNTVDIIASKYILSQNFQDLINLKDKNYCKNLVVLTSKILNDNLNRQQITYLAQYQKGDKIVYKLDEDDVLYFKKDNVDNIDEQNSIKKNRMCIGISAFYLKINYIFSAILTTLQPVALIKDTENDTLDTVASDVDNFESYSDNEEKHNVSSELAQEISEPNTSTSSGNSTKEDQKDINKSESKEISEINPATNLQSNNISGGNILSKFDLLSSDESKNDTETPIETPDTSKETSKQAPIETSKEIPEKTSETPEETPIETPKEIPEETSKETPIETSKEIPDETSKEIPDETPDETSIETPEETSDVSQVNSYANIETSKNPTLTSNENKVILGFITINSLCGKRIANLMNINSNFNIENFDVQKYDSNLSAEININPTICENDNNLNDEVGIPELERLYYDLFNFKFGSFNNMSDSAQNDYNNDLLDFYNVFTGSSLNNVSELKKLDPPITKFSDVQIDYKNILKTTCSKYDNKKNISGRSRDFREYAVRLQTMIKNTKTNQDKLLDILNQLFYVKKNKYPVQITINKNLNNQSLDKLLVETRLLIKNMYIQCDKDYRNVLKIFQTIVDKLELTTLTRQEEQMNILSNTTLDSQENTDANEVITTESEEINPDKTEETETENNEESEEINPDKTEETETENNEETEEINPDKTEETETENKEETENNEETNKSEETEDNEQETDDKKTIESKGGNFKKTKKINNKFKKINNKKTKK